MGVSRFTDLLMWQDARTWSKEIFQHTRANPFATDRRLVVQINDSSASVMANIAEGFGRGTQGEFIQFLGYAIGSLNETQSHLTVAYDRQYLPKNEYARLFENGSRIRMKVVAFIKQMVMPGSGVKNIRKVAPFSETVWELFERVTGQERPPHARPGWKPPPVPAAERRTRKR